YAPAAAVAYKAHRLTSPGPGWDSLNRDCFIAGYLRRAQYHPETGRQPILPTDPAVRSAVLAAFELDKALYEVAYERANRPDWARIPLEAVGRLTGAAARPVRGPPERTTPRPLPA